MSEPKRFYHPEMSSGVIRPTCAYGFMVDGVAANTSASGHKGRYAIDEGGANGWSNDWLMVPADGVPMRCVRVVGGTQAIAMFETTEEVVCADGEICVVGLEAIHCGAADWRTLGVARGKVYQPGQRFYREGNGGTASPHVHLQCYKGATGGAWKSCASGYAMVNEVPLNAVAFIPKGHAVVANGLPYKWQSEPEQLIGTMVVNSTGVRVRKGPGIGYAVCDSWAGAGTLAKGHKYAVLEQRGGWVRMARDRWVCADFVTVSLHKQKSPSNRYVVTATGRDFDKLMEQVDKLGLPCKTFEEV